MSELAGKTPEESLCIMTQVVLPNDTNYLNNLRGGKILHWMDLASAVSAQKHAERVVVTASVDNVSFNYPIKMGDVVTIRSKVTRSFRSSMEIHVEVWAENIPMKRKVKSNDAFFTFVALNDMNKAEQVAPVIPQTDEEQEHFEKAGRRRDLRLILAGKKKPEDSEDLKKLFNS